MEKRGIFIIFIALMLFSFPLVYALPAVIIDIPEPGVTIIQNQTTISSANETNRFQNLTTYDCPAGQAVSNIFNNGTVGCTATGASNIFDQELNTTNNVQFQNVTATGNFTSVNATFTDTAIARFFQGLFSWIIDVADGSTSYLIFNQSTLSFNESFLNDTIDDRAVAGANETNRLQNITTYGCGADTYAVSFHSNATINCTTVPFNFNQSNIEFNFNQSNIEFNFNQSIANETNRFQNLTNFDCASGSVVIGIFSNGTVNCVVDGGGGNIFDQDLNTTNNVLFANITSLGNLTVGDITISNNQISSSTGTVSFNNDNIRTFGTGNYLGSFGGIMRLQRDDSSIVAGNNLGNLFFAGADPVEDNLGASIRALATEEWNASQFGTELELRTVETGTTTITTRLIIRSDGSFDFVDNNLTTTGPLRVADTYITGGINLSSYLSCTALETDANGNLLCGSDASGGNIFDQVLNITSNVTFANITSTGNLLVVGNITGNDRVIARFFDGLFSWIVNVSSTPYLTFNESTLSFDEVKLNATISDLATGSANETNRLQNITTYDCPSQEFVIGFFNNGTVICSSDLEFNFNQSNIEFNFNQSNIQFNFNQSNIEFNFNQSIGNETNRFQNLTSFDCVSGNVVIGVFDNGTVECGIVSSTPTNIFNQDLNTTDSVDFQNITIEGLTTSNNATFTDTAIARFFQGLFSWVINLADGSTSYLIFNQSTLSFNESFLNDTIDDRAGSNINVFDQELNTTENVQFANITSTGNLTVSRNATFLSFVGIGTATPSTPLEVVGNITIDDGGSGGGCLQIRDTDDGGYTYCTALDGTLTCSTTPC